MKIGIVTQPLLRNYGGILQNYALQTVLRKLGQEPVTIDYIWNLHWYQYFISFLKTIILWFIPGHRRKFEKFKPIRKENKIADFVSENIATTEYVYHYRRSILKRYNFSAVITGSDQVWRPKYNPDLKDMYLDFVKNDKILKIAYAASFGTSSKEYSEKNIRDCAAAAKKLSSVSVRELSGVNLCKEYFGIKAVNVLDPTLLLQKEDYLKLTRQIPTYRTKYIGVYILDNKALYQEISKNISRNINVNHIRNIIGKDRSLSPSEWIALFRDAEFIITDSFHGTVFSIIFQKPFITFYNHSRGADRFKSLLAPLGLMNRLIGQECQNMTNFSNSPINWPKAAEILEKGRKESIMFLEESLNLDIQK